MCHGKASYKHSSKVYVVEEGQCWKKVIKSVKIKVETSNRCMKLCAEGCIAKHHNCNTPVTKLPLEIKRFFHPSDVAVERVGVDTLGERSLLSMIAPSIVTS